jgi:HAD superfamily hydrolase (TIGR01509 family)
VDKRERDAGRGGTARSHGFLVNLMIRALVFDFDGLILETEEPDYLAWQELYRAHGADLPLDVWCRCIGRSSDWFDPIARLEEEIGRPLDRETLREQQRRRHLELIEEASILPGVTAYLEVAHRLGLPVAIASSSRLGWVQGHLHRLGLAEGWACIQCYDDGRHAKPEPDLYLLALEALQVAPNEAIAFEDSPNGVRAAKRAGLWCVAVPNSLTRTLDLSAADLRLGSLEEMPLAEMLGRFS